MTLLDSAIFTIKHRNTPFALVVRSILIIFIEENTFTPYKFQSKATNDYTLNRE